MKIMGYNAYAMGDTYCETQKSLTSYSLIKECKNPNLLVGWLQNKASAEYATLFL